MRDVEGMFKKKKGCEKVTGLLLQSPGSSNVLPLYPLLLVPNRFDPAYTHTIMLPTLIRLHKAPPMPKFFQEGLTLDHVCT